MLGYIWLFATPWTVAHQALLYWSGLPFPTPGDLPDPGIKAMCPASLALAGRFFTTAPPGKTTVVDFAAFKIYFRSLYLLAQIFGHIIVLSFSKPSAYVV